MVGDWVGSQYDIGGGRIDYRLFLDHDGRYERIVRREPDYERRHTAGSTTRRRGCCGWSPTFPTTPNVVELVGAVGPHV